MPVPAGTEEHDMLLPFERGKAAGHCLELAELISYQPSSRFERGVLIGQTAEDLGSGFTVQAETCHEVGAGRLHPLVMQGRRHRHAERVLLIRSLQRVNGVTQYGAVAYERCCQAQTGSW